METRDLTSRLIASASYDEAAKLIFIQMRDGRTKTIAAPRYMFDNLVTAQSPGWYYTRHIKPVDRQ